MTRVSISLASLRIRLKKKKNHSMKVEVVVYAALEKALSFVRALSNASGPALTLPTASGDVHARRAFRVPADSSF